MGQTQPHDAFGEAWDVRASISVDAHQFSPNNDGVQDTINVSYSISEDVHETELVFLRNGTEFQVPNSNLRTSSGSYIYRWDGEDGNGRELPDGSYTLQLRFTIAHVPMEEQGNALNPVGPEHSNKYLVGATAAIIIDREPPNITRVQGNGNVTLVDGGYIAATLSSITVTADKGSGTEIDFTDNQTAISLTAEDGTVLSGATTLTGTALTLTLGNQLDTLGENGTYTLSYTIVDQAGNPAEGTTTFTYDTAAPTLISVATSQGDIPPSRGVNGEVTFVEATLADNLEDGLSRGSSTIRLTAPDERPVLGQQVSPSEDKIRLEFLTPLVPTNGEQDGEYTIVIDAVDKAGNRTETQVPFIYDNRAPQLVTLSASEEGEAFSGIQKRLYHSAPLYQIAATFSDANPDGSAGTGVDVETGATITFHPVGGTPAPEPQIIPDRDNNRVALLLAQPLVSRDGSQDGIYTLDVTVADRLGNTETESFQFIYDTQIPTLVSTVPDSNETVSSLTQVQVNLQESTSGIDFVQSTFGLMHNDTEVPVNITSNGTETATLTVLAPFAVDGSDDGLYVIEVTPVDRAGNQGAAARREFFLVSQTAPKIRLLRPETSTVNSLTAAAEGLVAVELVDYIGVGIDFDASTLVVKSPGGVPIPRNIAPAPADEENRRLTWRTEAVLPDDGSADGEYTITATFVDFSGQRWTEDFTFNVDTQFPRITTVQALTGTPTDMGAERIPVIAEAFSRITVGFEEDDIDIGNTAVTLTGPGGTDIAINLNVNVARGAVPRNSTVSVNFSKLLASGDYTLSVTPQDYVGNVSARPFVYRFRLDVDTELPSITSVVALTTPPMEIATERIPVIAEGFSRITVTFEETAGDAPTPLDIDIGNTAVSLTGPDGEAIAINVTHDGKSSLTLNFSRLTASGNYSLSVTPQDYAGNVSPRPFVYPFRLDVALPRVSAVAIGGKIGTVVYVNGGATSIVATLTAPTGTGLAFGNEGSRISVTNADGTEIPGVTTVQGTTELVWQAIGQPTDGTADGRYTVTVTPVDKAGRQGEVARRQFIYDTQSPQITDAAPLSLTAPVTFVTAGFASDTELSFTVADVGPAGVEMSEQTAQLLGADGTALSAVVTRNQTDRMFLTFTEPLAVDGSADGSYSIAVSLVDRAGNETQANYAVVYDTQVPQVSDVTLNTAEPTRLVATQPTVITELGFSELEIAFEEATTRVDFANTTMTLTGPENETLPLTLTPKGTTQVTARFVAPQALGVYTLSITPQDIAGNVARGAVTYRFRLDVNVPSVISVRIDGKVGGIVYVNGEATSIVATLVDPSGAGIALGEGGSTITVANAAGTPVPGTTTDNGVAELTWVPGVLPLDGTADGRYTVTITPRDKAGRQGAAVYRQFVFDTQPPRVTEATPIVLNQPRTYVNASFSQNPQVRFTVADVGPAALDLAAQQVHFRAPDGDEVPSALKHNETDQVFLTLTDPLPIDGSADGTYTVTLTLVDRAGNETQADYAVVYDTQVPQVSDVTLNTAEPTRLVATQPTVITELGFSELEIAFEEATTRVDFANTTVTLTNPEDETLSLTLMPVTVAQEPVPLEPQSTVLRAQFVAPQALGIYTLSITPQDIAGNTARGAVTYRFRLDVDLPSVTSVRIDGKVGGIVYVNGEATSIVATLVDPSGAGIALGEGGSTITVANAAGTPVPGTTTDNGVAELTWVPGVLPLDGTADGRYTVTITPRDKAGRQGAAVYRQFVFDTQPPRVTEATPIVLNQPRTYVNASFSQNPQVRFTVADVGPAALDLAAQRVHFRAPDGDEVPSALKHNETDQVFLTLTDPLPIDGSADGTYTVTLTLVDRAGNETQADYAVVYDTQVPQVSGVTLNTAEPTRLVATQPTVITELGFSELEIAFEEATTRVDFANTTVTLTNPEDETLSLTLMPVTVAQEPVPLEPQSTVLRAQFVAPQALGIYTLSITPQDIAGNTARGAVTYRFRLDVDLPSVTSVRIDGKAGGIVYVNGEATSIVAMLADPSGAGVALGEGGSTITVANAAGTPVPGTTTDDGVDALTWVPSALPLDGTADGRYTVTITPRDKAGRQGAAVYRQFVFDTQPPEITDASPMDMSQPVTYLSAPSALAQLSVTVADVGPAEFWVEEQSMTLLDAAGSQVPTDLTHNETDRLFLTLPQPLAKDGSEDGEYTVRVTLVDKSGNRYEAEHSIVYDTQAPQLVSTVPADGDILTDDVSQVEATLEDAGGSGIDFSATTLTLVAPGGTSITGALSNNGESELTLNLNPLVEDGRYRIRVQVRDRAGNGDALRFERSFLLSRTLPSVVSTEPVTAPAEDAFTNEKISRIEVELESADAKTEARHLSTLRLLGPGARVIPGQQQRDASRLTYTLARPLAQDGSEDGIYTIEFTPISASGRSGDAQSLTFTYDTEAPELETEDIQLVVTESGVNNSLTEIQVKLTDNQSGIDWENLDDDWLSFERISPNGGKTISGKVEDASQDTLRFRLTTPLADDGSNDGEYRITVSPKDRAGNSSAPYEKVFTYDTAPPVIDDSTLLINGAPLLVDANALDYPTAISTTGGVVIQANMFDDGLGVNLAQSRIVVKAPGGAQLAGTTQQNGVDTLVFKSAGLTTRGLYQVTVTSVGNDAEFLGFAPQDSITTEFLYETTAPTATLTSDGGVKELTDEALPLEGTATDPSGTQRIGDNEQQVPASGVWLVEIVGTGPDEQPIDPVPAVDDSNAEEEPWSRWSLDFLPSRSGEYDLDVRVTDKAGNYEVYDIGKYTMSVSLTFRGSTFGWPNPLRISRGDVAFFSFDVNVPMGDTVELTLSIYDWSGDMVLSQTYPDVVSGMRNDQLLKWNLRNQAGNPVARGIYIFRLEAFNATGNRANVVGKVLVVD